MKDRTIRHWYDRVKRLPRTAWAAALADQRKGCAVERDYDERIYQDFRDRYLQPRAVAEKVYRQTRARAGAEGWGDVPSVDTLLRHLHKREDPLVIMLEREGEKALRDALPHMRRDVSSLRAMEILTVDGHYLDLLVVWPDGEQTRICLIAVQDVRSRAYVGWHVAKSETAHDVRIALTRAIERYGIPGEVRFDNTFAAAAKQNTGGAAGRKRFRAKRVAGGEGAAATGEAAKAELKGVLPLCGIRVGFTQVAHGQSKPVERSFREIAEQVASWPGFRGAQTGPNPTEKPHTYGERVIPVAEVLPVLEHFITLWNTERGRRGGVANGRSYLEVFDESYQAHADQIARPTAEQMRLLTLVPEAAKIRQNGQLVWRGNVYWSAMTLARAGEEVVVRYDLTGSHHAGVWLYTRDGAPLGHVPCQETHGFRDEAAARSHNRARREVQTATKRLAKVRRRYDELTLASSVPLAQHPAPLATDVVRLATGLQLPALEPDAHDGETDVIPLFGGIPSVGAAPTLDDPGGDEVDAITAAVLRLQSTRTA